MVVTPEMLRSINPKRKMETQCNYLGKFWKPIVRAAFGTLFLIAVAAHALAQDTTELTINLVQGESKTETIRLGTCFVIGNTVYSAIKIESDHHIETTNEGLSAQALTPNFASVRNKIGFIAGRTAPVGEYHVTITFRVSDSPIIDNDSRTCIFTVVIVKVIITASSKPLIADFTTNVKRGKVPLEVEFQDKSFGDITNWEWFFGDSTSSVERNPIHNYEEPGIYDVILIVSGPPGSDTLDLPGYIRVSELIDGLVGRWKMVSGTDNGAAITDFDVVLDFSLDSLKVFWKGGMIRPSVVYEIFDGKIIAQYGPQISFPGGITISDFDYLGVAMGLGDITVSLINDTLMFSGVSSLALSSEDLVEILFIREIEECQLTVNLLTSDVSCFGDSTGSARIEGQNGQSGLGFQWSSGASEDNVSDLIAGDYSVTVTDNMGCEVIDSFTINQPAEIGVVIDSIGHDDGSQNGFIFVTITGGIAPYTTNWSNADGDVLLEEDIRAVAAGQYSLTVTDSHMCFVYRDSITVEMTTAVHERIRSPISVYPNPTTGIVYLGNPLHARVDARVTVFDLLGRRVHETNWQENRINLSELDGGYYVLKIVVDKEVRIMKILHN